MGDYPWAVYILSLATGSSYRQCGGSVIASEWVITAAHCVQNTGHGDIAVLLGFTRLDAEEIVKEESVHKIVRVETIFSHPDRDSDTALLRLAERVDLDIYTPVCLPGMKGPLLPGKRAWIVGMYACIDRRDKVDDETAWM